jgi:hypothetical protein
VAPAEGGGNGAGHIAEGLVGCQACPRRRTRRPYPIPPLPLGGESMRMVRKQPSGYGTGSGAWPKAPAEGAGQGAAGARKPGAATQLAGPSAKFRRGRRRPLPGARASHGRAVLGRDRRIPLGSGRGLQPGVPPPSRQERGERRRNRSLRPGLPPGVSTIRLSPAPARRFPFGTSRGAPVAGARSAPLESRARKTP